MRDRLCNFLRFAGSSRLPGLVLACAVSGSGLQAFETTTSRPPPERSLFGPVGGSASVYFGYDSNVPLVPDMPPFYPPGAREGYPFAGVSVHLRAEQVVDDTLSYGGVLDISGRYYLGSQHAGFVATAGEGSDYSRILVQPQLYLRKRYELNNGRSLELTPSYAFRFEHGKNVEAIGLRSHQLRLDGRLNFDADTRLDAFMLYTDDTFDVTFPGLPRRERDGNYAEIGVSLRHKFAGGRRAVTVGATFDTYDAEGIDWNFDGFGVFAGIEAHLGGRFYGTAMLSYFDRNYDGSFSDIIPGGRTDQGITILEAGLIYIVDARSAVRLDIRAENYSANHAAFEGDRTEVALSYTRNF